MASTIKLKNGSGAPTSGQLVQGEPALDLTNKRLYTENASGTVIEVGTNPSSLTTASADINGGTIDGTVIGGSSAAAGSFTTISASGEIAANGGVALPDNQKATFGDSDDLQIYHDGSNSYISDQGTGNLRILGDEVLIANAANNEFKAVFNSNGAASLYYDSSVKIATTATGIDVTGTVTADTVATGASTFTGSLTIDAAAASVTVKDSNDSGTTGYVFSNSSGNTSSIRTQSSAQAIEIKPNEQLSALFESGGDISFYEDTGTTAKFFWDASAESLGIGTTSPDGIFEATGGRSYVRGSNENFTLGVGRGGQTSNYFIGTTASSSPDLLFSNNAGTTNVVFTHGGNVGIGTSSPAENLHINSSSASARIRMTSADGSDCSIVFGDASDGATGSIRFDHSDNSLAFYGFNNSERMRIDSSGNLLVGTTTASIAATNNTGAVIVANGASQFSRDGGHVLDINRVQDGEIVRFRSAGNAEGSISISGSTTFYNITSDERLKENIVDTTHTVDINDIKVRQYDWKSNGEHQRYGFIAQELEAVYPEAVFSPEDPEEMKAVDYSKLVPLLVKEIQDLKAEVAALKGA